MPVGDLLGLNTADGIRRIALGGQRPVGDYPEWVKVRVYGEEEGG